MPRRLLSADVTTMPLTSDELGAQDVVDGSPMTSVGGLDTISTVDVGVWEMTRGTVRDNEVDEVFVVVAGRGTVTFDDGERLELHTGVAVRLRAGERTRWSVTQTLRKVWVA